ncbi:MAG: hypothetical protein Q9M91_05910 [Candidatus Dojkabacteria bacterium]|nr:hypothetical protein [Candidatus Dojkabacteria bacterium]
MNWPIIYSVNYLGSDQFEIKGYLDGNPLEAPFDIEICESEDNISGHGGCTQSLDKFSIVTDGEWSRVVTFTGAVGDEIFSALATNNNGSHIRIWKLCRYKT